MPNVTIYRLIAPFQYLWTGFISIIMPWVAVASRLLRGQFRNGETDARPMMIIPSPSAFSPSPKSYTTSTASFSQDQPCQIATFTASGLAGATKADIFAAPQISSDLSMALTLRTLAIYARTLRRLGIGCALMPVVELFGLKT